MRNDCFKILFLADTHLGFDSTKNPRISRRRRGDDFFSNFLKALQPAFDGKVDLVLHGGDLFYRSRVPDSLIDSVFEPILKVANLGIPFLIVPGNHERSFVPRSLFHTHPNLLLFDQPRTFSFEKNNITLTLSGFPFLRENIRDNFIDLVKKTSYSSHKNDFNFLCIHHAVEGATVGIQNYIFKEGQDVIRANDIPTGFDAVLSGHIHRAQILKTDLRNDKLSCPVIYPGSIERTSFVEREEKKGYFILELRKNNSRKSFTLNFQELYTRPMLVIEIDTSGINENQIKENIKNRVNGIDNQSVIQLRLSDDNKNRNYNTITADFLRSIVPETVNISLSLPGKRFDSYSKTY